MEKIINFITKPIGWVIGYILVRVLNREQQKKWIQYLRRNNKRLEAEIEEIKNGKVIIPND